MAAIVASAFPTFHAAHAEPPAPAPAPTQSAGLRLTLADALARARQTAPAASVRRARIQEAESRRAGAGVYPATNPLLEGELGPRIADAGVSPAVRVGLSQTFELGPRVSARLARVDADVKLAEADADLASQAALREVAATFVRALWAEARESRARDVEAIAEKLVDTAQKKRQAGDATALDLNVAKGTLARARADRRAMEAELDLAVGELSVQLGLPADARTGVEGSLDDELTTLGGLGPRTGSTHPALRAAQAELEGAKADVALGDALAYPDLGLGVRWETDEPGVHTVLGTLSITLPIFEHGQGTTAEARGRETRAQAELTASTVRVETTRRVTAAVAAKRRDAAHAFEAEGGVSAFTENLALATKALEAGELGMGDILLLRRELIDTETDRLDRLLEQRLAEIDALHAAGWLQ